MNIKQIIFKMQVWLPLAADCTSAERTHTDKYVKTGTEKQPSYTQGIF